jgi:hypothetical protein
VSSIRQIQVVRPTAENGSFVGDPQLTEMIADPVNDHLDRDGATPIGFMIAKGAATNFANSLTSKF